eukprot:6209477-Pleurochrysis_carterae.AAC.1
MRERGEVSWACERALDGRLAFGDLRCVWALLPSQGLGARCATQTVAETDKGGNETGKDAALRIEQNDVENDRSQLRVTLRQMLARLAGGGGREKLVEREKSVDGAVR